jgi:hypothetical protein
VAIEVLGRIVLRKANRRKVEPAVHVDQRDTKIGTLQLAAQLAGKKPLARAIDAREAH